MAWAARVVLFVPALIAGWFVSREDGRFWVVTMAIALVFLALTCLVGLYATTLRGGKRSRERR